MKRHFLLLLSTLLTLSLSAQQDRSILDFNGLTVDLPDFPYQISEIIDAREQTYCLGSARVGLSNADILVFSPRPIEEVFMEVLQISGENKPSITLRINRVLLREVATSSSEFAIAELEIDLLRHTEANGWEYYPLGAFTSRKGLDVTRFLPEQLIEALETCLKDFDDQYRRRKVQWRPGTGLEERDSWPMNQIEEPAPGIYWSYLDFRDQTPDSLNGYHVKYYREKKDIGPQRGTLIDENRGESKWNHYAVYDGEYLFVNMGVENYRCYPTDNGYAAFDYPPEMGDMALFMGYYFGLIGAVGGYLLELAITDKVPYYLDGSVGGFFPPGSRDLAGEVFLTYSPFNADGTELELILDGELVCTLHEGEYYHYQTAPGRSGIQVCIRSGEMEACEAIPINVFQPQAYSLRLKQGRRPKAKILLLPPDSQNDFLRGIHSGEWADPCDSSDLDEFAEGE